MNVNLNGKRAFLEWTKKRYPAVYKRAIRGQSMGALVVVANNETAAEKSAIEKAFDSVVSVFSNPEFMTGIAGAYQSKQMIDINVQRAKQGLPPVNEAFNPQVNFGLTGNTQMLVLGGLAIGALYLFTRK